MDAIKTYLETMLGKLPGNEESFRLRNELLISMEEKYSELKAAGKSENEAIGTVISEFGNIEELVEEIGVAAEKTEGEEVIPEIDLFTVQSFLAQLKETSRLTAAGVFMILLGIAAFIAALAFSNVTIRDTDTQIAVLVAGIAGFIIFLAVAVGFLSSAWLKFLKYDFIYHKFRLSEHVRQYVNNFREKSLSGNITMIAVGVTIIVLSLIAVIVPIFMYGSVNPILLGVAVFLALTGAGTVPLIIAGLSIAYLNMLLGRANGDEWLSGVYIGPQGIRVGNEIRIDEDGIRVGNDVLHIKDKDTVLNKIRLIGVVNAVFWPLVTAGYLLWSFISGDWHITWLVWPVAALISGAISGGIGAFYSLGGGEK
jgi:hypothetical protein